MVSVDEHTQVAMEIVSQGTKLSGELLLKVLKALNDFLSSDDKQKDFILKDNSKEGKQKRNVPNNQTNQPEELKLTITTTKGSFEQRTTNFPY
ncbi:hypothetical protein [Bacillus wiedmannii]|uniref:hypothetical protein n=1 Tax=Bacillus wiedmannii TaxID=1890302 RepID=UPI000D08D89E|nr:hypothetical protein [Bacillus wiedmannii]PRT15259.1 hypothetical protein C6360_28125 [Bacillus wiedmannii]